MQYDEYTCEGCGMNGVDQGIRKAFNVNYCRLCKSKLSLITQTTAVKDYLLSRDDLRGLAKMEMVNPRDAGWKPMMLYRKADVERVSQQKYADVEQEKEARKEKQKERRSKAIKKKLLLLRRTLKPKMKQEAVHVHSFDAEGKCACGLAVEVEEI
ncbi:DNA-repair protein complementing XP-A cells [Nematocida major]|uniref:DNA-repair protein complementing XP-A cells n=1 Tax=Nematocida major TaxID=1912982 RepID=UPI002008D778|nr:DNA-repair protein complementing XP-A cells [Nematocida major]KAH9386621.1 DNA-repair protein complementing XP-A cells [Nematocida major]